MTPPTDHRDLLSDGVEPAGGELHNPDVAHEHSDINVRAIMMFIIGLSVVCTVAAGAMWGVFTFLDSQAARNDPTLSPLAPPPTDMPRRPESPYLGNAPEPKLITSEPSLLADQHKKEQLLLHSGDWTDRNTGMGRIPIDEAKKLMLHKGLPTRAGDPVDPRLGTRAASMSDASSGRNAVVKQAATGGAAAQPQPPAAQPSPPGTPKAEQKPGGGH